jgi:hypothetical protein
MTTIDLVYVNAGGGHRSAALALEVAIREQRKDWQVRLVNLFKVLDPQDIFRRTTGVKPEDYYNVRLARGWTLGLAQELRILQMLIRLSHKSLVAQLRRHWQATRPDLSSFVCGTPRAEMRKLRLDPDRPTGMVMFFGHGSRVMRGISKRLDDVQLILACGHNAVLAEELRNLPASAPRLILGFTSQIGYYMQLSDFFVGKPGPGSISEAVQHGLPVIVVRNAWTMPQERYNTQWIEQKTVGVVLDSFKDIDAGVAHIAKHIDLYRAGVRCIRNRAVFEIPEILEGILALPARVGVDLAQHFGTAERLHLS